MKFNLLLPILAILSGSFIFGQQNLSGISEPFVTKTAINEINPDFSNIIRSTLADTAFLKVEMKNAFYEPGKNNFPYYSLAKTTAYEQTAQPTLIIKKVLPVSEPHASVIKKYFGKFLSREFSIVQLSSLSRNENLNQHQLFPFRLNAAQQLEELTGYDVSWQVTANNNRSMRNTSSSAFSGVSVLASGAWYKLGVSQTGIHKISKSLLTTMGVDVAKIDPTKIRLYGNGGAMVPELNSAPRYDDLIENSIVVVGESDLVFNDNDYILFYATGPNQWKKNNSPFGMKFSHSKNLYSDTSYYFLTVDKYINGKRATKQTVNANSNISSNSYDYYNFHEEDLFNFIKSGRSFYGEYFDINSTYNFNWNDGDFSTTDTLMAEATIATRSRDSADYLISGSGLNFKLRTYSVNVDYYLAEFADARTKFSSAINTGSANINISITKQSANAVGWLDKLTINARRKLVLNAKQFQFRDSRVTGPGKVCAFSVTAPATSTVTIWNVTDQLHPSVQDFTMSGGNISFKAATDSLTEFCITPSTDFFTPVFFGKVPNQNLHSYDQADYVIITHPLFLSHAQRVGQLHLREEGLTYKIATTDQVYNEFGGGKPDISAIRDFVRMLYSRGISKGREVKYVLLMGDGSFKNKSRSLLNNSNLIPTYQSQNSLSPTESLVTDDFFALMDPSEGYLAEGPGGRVDLGTGRLTCRNVAEMNGVVAKIESYYKKDAAFKIEDITPENCNNLSESNLGDWRNWLMFLADDKDGAEHMEQADSLTKSVLKKTALFNFDKILLDAYQRFSTPGGKRYPDATEDFLRRLKKGVLIFNYTGHGGEVGLTEERILDVPTINAFDNANKLPLFITATCEFSRYDDPDRTSAGELCLLNSKGGAVALLTTCRVAYSTPNFSLNKLILENLFTKVNGRWPTLGDVVMKTKAQLVQSKYYANFHLLGDPAMPLAYPQQKVVTSKINNVPVSISSSDTLSALAKVTVNGYIADTSGNKLSNFNGIVYSSVFDKERKVSCLLNDPESAANSSGAPFQFTTQKNILYRGKSKITNGDFSFTFLVPKDISFAPGQGRISYYATNGQNDAAGSYSNVIVGGGSGNIVIDNDGPQVNLFLNDKNFINGGTTNEKPILYADLTDSSGINTVGNGVGHDISVVLDATGNNPVVLNDYYEANLNSYQSGRVRYPFNELSEGEHRLTFKVWDIQNNSNTAYSDFIVAKSAELALKHVLNYPNPFTTRTKFFFEHNQACNPLKVTIQVFTISGKAVKTIQKSITCEGFRPEGIEWDGKDDYGDKLARGVYIYKLAILDIDNKKAEKIEKLVILN